MNRLRTTIPTTMKKVLIFALAACVLAIISQIVVSQKSYAAYDGGRIIDNAVFLDANSMSASQIQSFLVSKGSGLASKSFVLSCYGSGSQERQWYTAAGATCDTPIPASHIIYYASKIYGVNPKVILATMQKEQSLTTAPNPTSWQLNQAMGYGCPTSGQCGGSSTFPYQIDSGTWALRYHYERARGNMTWWYSSSSWTCGTEKNYYKPNLYPGQNVRFHDQNGTHYRTHYIANAATSAFYCYTPHAYNNPSGLYGLPKYGTTGMYYSGSYNFVYFFEAWFGGTHTSPAIKSANSGTVYIQADGYKFSVPSMAMLQDYGISPGAIKTVSQSILNAIPAPAPDTGLSTSIGYLVKSGSDSDADSGTVYLVSVGKRYAVQSLQQLADFGFTTAQIKHLPLSYIQSIPDGGALSSFISTPSNNVFRISGGEKRIIFSGSLYNSLNTSGRNSRVSGSVANLINSGMPISNVPILVRKQNTTISLFLNETYYSLPSMDVYNCWGFSGTQSLQLYTLASDSYVGDPGGAQTLNCMVRPSGSAQTFILNRTNKMAVPEPYQLSGQTLGSDLTPLITKLPSRSASLSRLVKANNSATVYYVENGLKRPLPSYANLSLLGYPSTPLDTIDGRTVSSIEAGQIKLGNGKAVKTDNSAAVYSISGNTRILYDNPELFLAHGNKWSDVETYSSAYLNENYPYNGQVANRFLKTDNSAINYLVDSEGCKLLNTTQLISFGQVSADIPLYSISDYPKLKISGCKGVSAYVKSPSSQTVYFIENGEKIPISSWVKLQEHSNSSNPQVSTISSSTLNALATGTGI